MLIPEYDYDLDSISKTIRKRHRSGHSYSIVVVAEGVEPPDGYEPLVMKKDAFGFGMPLRMVKVVDQGFLG